MSKVVLVARILLGLIFTVFSLNFWFQFLPMPEMTPAAGAFMGALMETGYMMPMIKIVELTCGILLLIGLFVPLALTLIAPIVVNILAFHVFLDPAGLPIAILVVALNVFLAWAYRSHYAGVLTSRAEPTA